MLSLNKEMYFLNNALTIERKFRPEIEGLRVIAALLVAVYHIWIGKVSGGVDVFFVISGFLITTSIVSRYNRYGELKFLPYVTNLIKRLLPSIIIVVLTVIILSVFLLPRTILDKTFYEIIASLFYYQNWQLALSNTDYLSQEQMSTPLEHFWAMSIQGQFYLIWFVLFAFTFYLLKKNINLNGVKIINYILIILFISSFTYSIYLTSVNQPWAYFDTFTRVWEFSIGGILAINLSKIKINSFISNILGWVGFIGLLLTGIIFDVSTMFPGYIALWPTLCAVAILIAGNSSSNTGVTKFLGSNLMVKLGGIAFGIYLWHWVLLSFYNYHSETNPSILIGITIIITSIVLALFMSKFIETPFKNMEISIRPLKYIGYGILINLFILIGLFTIYNKSVPNIEELINDPDYPGASSIFYDIEVPNATPIPTPEEAMNDLADSYDDKMNQSKNVGSLKIGEYGQLENNQYTVALVGSSHSAHWLGALQYFAEEENIKILNIVQVGSRFSSTNTSDTTAAWNNNVMNYLEDSKNEIDLVVATSDIGSVDSPLPPEGMANQLNTIGDEIKLPIMAIRDTQRFGFNIPEYLDQYGYKATKEKMNSIEPISETMPWEKIDYKSPLVHPVDYNDYFKVNGEYEPVIGNVLVYFDGSHITNTYSKTMGPVLREDVIELLDKYSS